MRKLFIVCSAILFFTSVAIAGTNVSFNWDANNASDGVVTYNLYRSPTSGTYSDTPVVSIGSVQAPAVCPGGTCAATEDNVPDGKWYWVCTAEDAAGFESGYSNEVTATLDSVAPNPPGNLTIWQKVVAWIEDNSGKLYGWVMKFFRDNPDFEISG